METWTHSECIFEGKVFTIRKGDVVLDDGLKAYREVVEHPGGVCILPYDGHVVTLVRQFRIAVGEYVLEAPAGKLEKTDTDPAARGRAELEEEAGYLADTLIPAGEIFASVGFCSERIYLYLALDLTVTTQQLEPEERIELVQLNLEEVRDGLKHHRFNDAKTIVLLQALLNHLDEA